MNTLRKGAVELARAVGEGVRAIEAGHGRGGSGSELAGTPASGSGVGAPGRPSPGAEVVIFPPFPWLLEVCETVEGLPVAVGAQDLSGEPCGAHTGQVSGEMILDCGAEWVIIGHSERRHGLDEPDSLCGQKLQMALKAGLRAVFCVGETWEERSSGRTDEVNARQLAEGFRHVVQEQLHRIVIAYEPVWAIGTGRTATPADAAAAHRSIREFLRSMYDAPSVESVRILYGGSVNASNAGSLLAQPEIDGGLIGGASLKPSDFLAIVAAASATPTTAST